MLADSRPRYLPLRRTDRSRTASNHSAFILLRSLHAPETAFTIGKAILIRDGYDLTYVACGETVSVALEAARREVAVEEGCLLF